MKFIVKKEKAMKGKVYISGPISNRPFEFAMHHFALAEAKLQAQGYRTCNPLRMRFPVWLALHCGHWGYVTCLLLQLLWMWWTCSCIYLLTDWHTSDGARLERSFARCLGLTAIYEKRRKPLGNVPAPTHVLTPEKKTSKKHKKTK